MIVDIQCSCCGSHAWVDTKTVQSAVDVIKSGWGSCGTALYCPKCTATWHERNGDREMADEKNTFYQIMNRVMRQKRGRA